MSKKTRVNYMPSEVMVKVDAIIAHCVSQLDNEIQKDYINGGERDGRTANIVYYTQKHLHDLSDRLHVNCQLIQETDPNFN